MAPDDSPVPTPPAVISLPDSQIDTLRIGDVAGQSITKITIIPIILTNGDRQYLLDLVADLLTAIRATP